MLNWLVEEKQVTPHIPVLDRSKREDGTFSREDFRYDESSDTYICPADELGSSSATLSNCNKIPPQWGPQQRVLSDAGRVADGARKNTDLNP